MTRLIAPLLLLLVVVGAALVTDRPMPRADFTFINTGDISTLDLQRLSWMQDVRVARLLYEGLVRSDVFTWDYAVMGAAADRWEVSEDKKTYRFHLRDGTAWSNGDRLRAGDFVFAWRRALLPETSSDYSGQFELIRGGRAFFEWRTKALADFAAGHSEAKTGEELWARTLKRFDETVGVHAADDSTLVVELEHPTPYFLDLCMLPAFFPVYPPLVSQYERPDPKTGRIESRRDWTKPPLNVSNGPFRMTVWRFKRDLRMEKNPYWWGRDTLALDTVCVPCIDDQNAQVLAFQTGAVDWSSDTVARYRPEMVAKKAEFYREHAAEVASLRAQGLDAFEIDRRLPPDPRNNIHPTPAFGVYWYNFNCLPTLRDGRKNPFADPRVRRAFAMAVDKKTLTEQVMRIGCPVATTIIPPGSIPGYVSPKGLPFDPAAARRLLAEAGYPDPRAFPVTVEILINTEGDHDIAAQFIARNWQDYLGVQVAVTRKEIKVFRDDLKNANYMVSRAGWYGDYGDPMTFLEVSRTGDGNNDRKYSSAAFDALLDRSALEEDPAKRMAILSRAEKMIVEDDLPMIPIYQYVSLYEFDARKVSGVNPHPRSEQYLFLVDMLGDGKGSDKARMMPVREWAATGPQGHMATAAGGGAAGEGGR
jgi:oligopeptide transport system substrate-binding protein